MTDQPTNPDTIESVAASMENAIEVLFNIIKHGPIKAPSHVCGTVNVCCDIECEMFKVEQDTIRNIKQLLTRYRAITSQANLDNSNHPEKPDSSLDGIAEEIDHAALHIRKADPSCEYVQLAASCIDAAQLKLAHHNDEQVSKAMHLLKQVEDMGLTVEQALEECEIYNDLPVLSQIASEIKRAVTKFPTWPTDPLHAVGVVAEEMGELQKEVMQLTYEPSKSTQNSVSNEAIQLAAMSIRFLLSLKQYVYIKREQHVQSARTAEGGEG